MTSDRLSSSRATFASEPLEDLDHAEGIATDDPAPSDGAGDEPARSVVEESSLQGFPASGGSPLRPHMGYGDWFATCELIGWSGDPPAGGPGWAFCRWCGTTPLPARRRSWCSDECHGRFLANHYWPWARSRALQARQSCVLCGMGLWAVLLARDDIHRTYPDARLRNDIPADVWGAYEALRKAWELEVDHITPLHVLVDQQAQRYPGRHYAYRPSRHAINGCHHHQANLRVLCHECHVDKTKADRRAARVLQNAAQAELPGALVVQTS